jgi:hypothetical protein
MDRWTDGRTDGQTGDRRQIDGQTDRQEATDGQKGDRRDMDGQTRINSLTLLVSISLMFVYVDAVADLC